jgi:hypothetical protein
MVRPQPILGYLRYVGVGRRAINPFNQRRIIRICLRAIDPLRHRPALQVVGQGLASDARLPSTKSCRKLSSRPRGGNAQAPHRWDTLEIVSCTANTPTSPRPNLRVAIAALGRCNCFAELHGLADCQICIPSTASHVMSGTLRRVGPSSSRNCMPEQRQPQADHPGYQAIGSKRGVIIGVTQCHPPLQNA